MPSDQAIPRTLDLRISAAPEIGYIVWRAGEPIAALTWRHELCGWLFDRLGEIPGELEREAQALAAAAHEPQTSPNVEPFPRVVAPRSEPRRRGFFRGA